MAIVVVNYIFIQINGQSYGSFNSSSFRIHLRIEFISGCIYGIMNARVKLANL